VAITSVGQEYEFTESQHDYKTGTGTIFGGKGASMDIGKFRDNYDKEGRSRCFNCNIYKHMAKKCWKCYDSKLKGLSNELTLVLSDTRELDGVLSTK